MPREVSVDLRHARDGLGPGAKGGAGAVGRASELEAARRELVNLRNRISALREERGRLAARLKLLEEGAEGALTRLGLDARERYEEKLAVADALANTERALRSGERALLRLEALVARLEAEATLAGGAGGEGGGR